MVGNKGGDTDDSPELEEVNDPEEKTKKIERARAAHALTRIDPILMEKLERIETAEPDNGYVPKTYNISRKPHTPPLAQSKLSQLWALVSFLLFASGVLFTLRWYYGQEVVPPALTEAVHGSEEVAPAAPPARIQVQTDVLGYELYLDGVKQELFNNQLELPAPGRSVKVLIKRFGLEDFETSVTPVAGTTIVINPVFTPVKATGFLNFESVPEAKVTLYQKGQKLAEYNTPMTGLKLPVGTYQAVVENSLIGYRLEETIIIYEWQTTNVRKQLSGQQP